MSQVRLGHRPIVLLGLEVRIRVVPGFVLPQRSQTKVYKADGFGPLWARHQMHAKHSELHCTCVHVVPYVDVALRPVISQRILSGDGVHGHKVVCGCVCEACCSMSLMLVLSTPTVICINT